MISPPQSRWDDELLLLLGADVTDDAGHHQGRAHGVGGGPGPVELLHERQHLEGVPTLSPELLGPSGGQPAPLDQMAVEVPAVMDPGPLHLVPHLVGEDLVEEVPGLLPEDLAAFAQSEVHDHIPPARADSR
jgi:hypothetical protein